MRWGDYDRDRRELRVRGKGSKDRVIPVTDELREILATITQTDDPLIVGLTDVAARYRITTFFARLGVHVTPHMLRHAYATRVADRTCDLQVVARLLGHESVATTEVYAAMSTSRLHAAAQMSQLRPPQPAPRRRSVVIRRAA